MEFVSLVVFLISYLLFILLPKKRTLIAVFGAVLLFLIQAVSLKEALLSINWNVMGIFVGTLVVADVFMKSRVPAYLAELIVNKA
ncbi:MAG: arsenic transporter, partial [Candidatus Aminicenantes bacterium]|nr:arsenic transporter [Candidatus Aminicenantes bacterium]